MGGMVLHLASEIVVVLEPVSGIDDAAVAHAHGIMLHCLTVFRMALAALATSEEDLFSSAQRNNLTAMLALSLERLAGLHVPDRVANHVVLLDRRQRTLRDAAWDEERLHLFSARDG